MGNTLQNFRISQLEPRCVLEMLLHNLWMVVLSAVSFALAATMLVTVMHHDTYGARVTFVVNSRSATAGGIQDASTANSTAATFSDLLTSSILHEKVTKAAGMPDYDGTITAVHQDNTNLVNLSLTAPTARKAFVLMNSILDQYSAFSDYICRNGVISVLNAPTIYTIPGFTMSMRRLQTLAGLLGAAIMIGFLILQMVNADTVQTENGAARQLDTQVLATIRHEHRRRGRKKRALYISDPTVSFNFVESIHRLRARIEQQKQDCGSGTFLLCSVTEHEGKSLLTQNLALSLAERCDSVLIVDADLRKPSIYSPGNRRSGAVSESWEVVREFEADSLYINLAQCSDNPSLYALYAPQAIRNSLEFLGSDIFKSFIQQLQRIFEYILIDTPPMGLFSDAEVLAEYAGSSILVVRQAVTPAPAVNDAIDVLSRTDAALLGCVLNDVRTLRSANTGYGSGTYGKYGRYGSYDSSRGKQRKEAARGTKE